jgi:hypothetical protein
MRHDILHFVTVLHSYVMTSVLDSLWTDFQKEIREHVTSLDELCEAHNQYLNTLVFRCGKRIR